MDKQRFMIQRYARGLWPKIRGERPFIVRGPRWSLASTEDFNILPATDGSRRVIAHFLLEEGAVSALWSTEMETCVQPHLWWDLAVLELTDEILPLRDGKTWAQEVRWTLELMSEEDWYNHLLVEDRIKLERMTLPEGLR
jgi:hypothetical protein